MSATTAVKSTGGRPANFAREEYDYETVGGGNRRATPPVHCCTKCKVPDPTRVGDFNRKGREGIPFHSTYWKTVNGERVEYVTPACILCERSAARSRKKKNSQGGKNTEVVEQVKSGTPDVHAALQHCIVYMPHAAGL